jgi:hypothetical protein
MKLLKVLTFVFATFIVSNNAFAQLFHFSVTEGDPTNSMTILMDSDTDPTLDGIAIEPGDEIGMFNKDGVCVGAIAWENDVTYITAWGKDGSTPGYLAGEEFQYRLWSAAADKEYDNITVVHHDVDDNVIDGEFDNNLPYIYISSFTAVSTPTTPVLDSPADMADGIYLSGNLVWNSVLNADSYSIMVSKTSDFSSDVVVDETDITSIQYPYTLSDYNTIFYWKVKATDDEDGDSDWSETWEFTTYNGETKEVEVTLYLNGLWNGTAHKPVAVSIELRTGESIMSSTVSERKAAMLNSDGTAIANFGQLEDGDYWIIVRASGYLPLAAPAKVSLSDAGVIYNFTTSSAQAISGTSAMIENTSDLWEARPGDFDFDRSVAAFDINYLIPSIGYGVSGSVPAP